MNYDKLKEFAATIKHCGDYGYLFANPTTKDVWWVAGDGDFNSELVDLGMATDSADIFKGFKIEGVDSVTIEAECSPNEDDGYLNLGKFGIDNWDEVNDFYQELH